MKNSLAIVLLLLIGICVNAQYKFEYLTTKDGLSTNRIRCIYRDNSDYVWIGSEIGLNRYDSYEIKAYLHNSSQPGAISSNDITHIVEDKYNNLWVGTSDGLNLYLPEADSFIVFRHDPENECTLDNNEIADLFIDTDGNLWVSTQGSSLNKWDQSAKQFIRYPIENCSAFPIIQNDSKGNIWLVGEGLPGLYKFDPETGNITNVDGTINLGARSRRLFIDQDDILWITQYGVGLFSYDTSTGKLKQYSANGDGKGTNGAYITSKVIEDSKGHLWLGVDQGGINVYDKDSGTFEYIMYNDKELDGLSNNGIWGMYKDKEGIVWIGTSGGGVNIYNPVRKKFKLYRHNAYNPNSVSSNIVGCFEEDSDGMIWIGTDNSGVDVLNPETGKFKNYKHDPNDPYSLSTNTIRCIVEDENKDMWIGTWNEGLNRFDRESGKFYCYLPDSTNKASLSGSTIWHSIIDHNGIFWLAIHNVGIDLFDKEKGVIKRFVPDPNNPNALSNAKVWYLFEDSSTNIWICTNDGLNLYNRAHDSFMVYRNLPSVKVKAITEDKDNNLWVGTENGICQINADGTVLQAYNSSNGLAGNVVNGIVCDNKGNIWISTNNLISKFDPQTKTFENFTDNDGLQNNSFFQESFLKTREGQLYFGGFNGFNSFYPDSIRVNTTIPPVYINEFQIFNKPVTYGTPNSPLKKHISQTSEITLTHSQSVFSFGFVAINYTSPYKNKYAYKMEGFEEEWNYTDAERRYTTYTNLNPGEYVFRVKASNNDGIWNEEGASVKINILPAWWQKTSFKVFVILFILLLTFVIFQYRVRVIRLQKLELQKLVGIQTKELKQKNIELIAHQKQLEEQSKELKLSNEQLDELNKSKDKFFSIVAHDLKNPFGTIIGLSSLLIDDEHEMSRDEEKEIIKNINSSTEKIHNLLENLLLWSRSQLNRIEINPSFYNLTNQVYEVLLLLEQYASSKNIKLIFDENEKRIVFADKHMIDTVLRNLIANAIKFSSENHNVIVKLEADDNNAICSITDEGVGMTKEQIAKLFKIDQVVSTQGTMGEKGTGLGLSLCLDFLEKNGGRIWVSSSVGSGSTFYFSVPVSD